MANESKWRTILREHIELHPMCLIFIKIILNQEIILVGLVKISDTMIAQTVAVRLRPVISRRRNPSIRLLCDSYADGWISSSFRAV